MTIILPATLCLAAACALVNFWLGMRIGKIRHAESISVGDGGNEALIRRMRAQANFIEQAPGRVLIGIGQYHGELFPFASHGCLSRQLSRHIIVGKAGAGKNRQLLAANKRI